MAKKKKVIEKKKVTQKKEVISVELKNIRIVKADPLNWRVDKRNQKGEFTESGHKSFYGSLERLFPSVLESQILAKKEVKSLKKLSKQIEEAKAELKEALKDLKGKL